MMTPVQTNKEKKGPDTRRPTALNKRPHSVSRVSRRKSPVNFKKSERRCQSWSSTYLLTKPADQLVPTATDDIDPKTCQSTTGSDDKNLEKISHCLVSKMSRILTAKKREFIKLRKNYIAQQKTFLESYAQLKEIETRAGVGSDEVLGDVRVLSVTDWPAYDLLLLVRDDLKLPLNNETASIFGAQVLQQIADELTPLPDELLSVCTELMVRRLDILTMLREKNRLDRHVTNSGVRSQNLKVKNSNLDEETENLRKMIESVAENFKTKINYVKELAKLPWLDRDTLNKNIERVQKENMKLQKKIETVAVKATEKVSQETVSGKQQNFYEELMKEKAARDNLKEVVASAESMLRVARSRINALERQLKETKTELQSVKKKHKEMEQLFRHRESSYDARSKKLLEVSKTGEVTIDTLSRQRDALEIRVKELREQAEKAEQAAQAREAEQRSRVDSLQSKVAEQEKMKTIANNQIAKLEQRVNELKTHLLSAKQCSAILMDCDRSRCMQYIPTKELKPSEKETEIYKELQATRMEVVHLQQELNQSRADKDSFLNSLSRIAQEDGSDKVQGKIASELLEREKEINKLQRQIQEHCKNEKIMVQHIQKYENQLSTLSFEVNRLRSYNCYSEIPYNDLQTELLDLQMKVEAMSHERAAFASAAASRALMLERHERSVEYFARVVRARRELCMHLSEETPPPLDDARLVEASRSLSMLRSDAANTWSSLRAERARVQHLERIVMEQNLQLQREAQVRTKLENQRAMLERGALHAHEELLKNTAYYTVEPTLESLPDEGY